MEVRPGYKQTEAGLIPEEWTVSTVGHEFEVKLGKMLDADRNAGTPKPYLGNRAVQWDRIDTSDLPTVPMSRTDIEKYRLQHGDLLVCEGGEVGRCAIWESPLEECYYQKALHRLRPLRGFDPRLMAAFLRTWSAGGSLANYVTQTSIAHLPREKFMEVPLAVPPAAEQRAIAAALSDMDSLLVGLDRLIDKKRDIKQAAMQQLLTGQTRLPGFRERWTPTKLGDLLSFKNGLNKAKPFFGHGTPIVNYMDVFRYTKLTTAKIAGLVSLTSAEIRTFDVRKGDVFFTRTSETTTEIGMAAVMLDAPEDTVFSGFLLRGRPADNRLRDEFKAYCFQSASVRRQIVAKASYTTRALTNGRLLSSVVLNLPSGPEQSAIAEVLSDMDAELIALEARRDKTRALKQGMMQELLTGRTRLV
jgi:type I restriction enzyme S subunit